MKKTGWREKDDYTIREIRAYMERERLDTFIPWKPTHIGYLTNYYDTSHLDILVQQWEELTAFLVIPLESDAFVVGAHKHFIGMDDSVKPWWITERHNSSRDASPKKEQKIINDTADLIKQKGLGRGRIGVETKWLPVEVHAHLTKALPDVEFVAANCLVPQIRFKKTVREQGLIRKASELGLRSMEAYMLAIAQGADRREAELVRATRALEYGGEFFGGANRFCWTGGNDANTAWWDPPARHEFEMSTDGKTWKGVSYDSPFFVTHFEAKYQGYYTDLAWHQFHGPEPDQDDVFTWGERECSYGDACADFEIVRRAQSGALGSIRPGMNQMEAKRAVEDYLESDTEAKERVTTYFVHSIGLEIHEEPALSARLNPVPFDGAILYQEGSIVASEWFTDLWTVEEPFLLTATGWEPLVELKGLVG